MVHVANEAQHVLPAVALEFPEAAHVAHQLGLYHLTPALATHCHCQALLQLPWQAQIALPNTLLSDHTNKYTKEPAHASCTFHCQGTDSQTTSTKDMFCH